MDNLVNTLENSLQFFSLYAAPIVSLEHENYSVKCTCTVEVCAVITNVPAEGLLCDATVTFEAEGWQ